MIASGMAFLSDILLGAGALAAAFYCVVLSRKLNRLTGLDQELGTAIAVLSKQVDEMTTALEAAQTSATRSRDELGALTERAESVAHHLNTVLQVPIPSSVPAAADIADLSTAPIQRHDPPPDAGGLADGAPSLFVRHPERVAS